MKIKGFYVIIMVSNHRHGFSPSSVTHNQSTFEEQSPKPRSGGMVRRPRPHRPRSVAVRGRLFQCHVGEPGAFTVRSITSGNLF